MTTAANLLNLLASADTLRSLVFLAGQIADLLA